MLFRVCEDEIHDEDVMSEVLVLLLLFSFFMGFESRSVSIFFRHREKYQVKDQQERQFIELPDELVELLDLEQPSVGEDQLESQLNQLTNIQNEVQPPNKQKKTEVVKTKVPDIKFMSEQSDDEDYNQSDDEEKDDINDDNDNADSYFEPENETGDRNYQAVESDDLVIDNEARKQHRNEANRQRHHRLKRAAKVNEQWRHSLPGHKKPHQRHEDDIIWEEVTDKDLQRAKYGEFITTVKYVGITLLSVTCFVFIGYCFIRDPVAFVFAFGSGCPCCIVCCPCIRKFTDKYLNVKKIIRESMNRYMPGMIINDDGTFDTYEPTGEELAIMEEIMEEMLN